MTLVVVLAAIAAFGSTASSATELCAKAEDPCEAANIVEEGTTIKASAVEPVVFASSGNPLKCNASTLESNTTAESGRPLPGKVASLTFKECKRGAIACTATTLNAPYASEIEKSGEDKAIFTMDDEQGKSVAVESTCATVECEYTAGEVELSFTGGSPGTITAQEEPFEVEGDALCPETASWTGKYKVEAPNPVHVAEWSTTICSVEPEEEKCPEGNEYSGEIKGSLVNGQTAELEFIGGAEGVISCTEESVKGTIAKNGTAEITSHTYSSNGGKPCTSTIKENPKVEVEVANLPFEASLDYQPPPAATGQFFFGGFLFPPLYIVRWGGATCTYVFWFSNWIWDPINGTLPRYEGSLIAGGSPPCGLALEIRGRVAFAGVGGILHVIP